MNNKVFSCALIGLQGQIVEVQADVSNGLPSFNIVGLGDTSVQESRERVRSSIKNSGAEFPQNRKTINLAPAQLKKQGSLFDLPIAISILLASQQIPSERILNSMIIGELSLNGDINKITGALAITQCARENGFKKIFLPEPNAQEAAFINDIEIYPLKNLRELIDYALGKRELLEHKNNVSWRTHSQLQANGFDNFRHIISLQSEKRALMIAAAGGHNVLLSGPPGTGKTLLARAFPSLLPGMSENEVLETTKIFSIAGLLDSNSPLISRRPFREVHHSASAISVIGGGNVPKPGEISLAHNGVLFFDEIAEFPRQTLEALRQPLEDKFIHISRANYSLKFPSNFIFLATMNPCPCGHKNDPKLRCICSETQVLNYQKRISGPILDRFDIFLFIPRIVLRDREAKADLDFYTNATRQINTAVNLQRKRFKNFRNIHKNSDMPLSLIEQYCQLGKEENLIINQAAERLNLSNRAYFKTIKLARTIADLEGNEKISGAHLREALQYRKR